MSDYQQEVLLSALYRLMRYGKNITSHEQQMQQLLLRLGSGNDPSPTCLQLQKHFDKMDSYVHGMLKTLHDDFAFLGNDTISDLDSAANEMASRDFSSWVAQNGLESLSPPSTPGQPSGMNNAMQREDERPENDDRGNSFMMDSEDGSGRGSDLNSSEGNDSYWPEGTSPEPSHASVDVSTGNSISSPEENPRTLGANSGIRGGAEGRTAATTRPPPPPPPPQTTTTVKDHLSETKATAITFINRLEDEYSGKVSGVHLMVGKLDPCTIYIKKFFDFCSGKCSFKDLEKMACSFGQILATKMALIALHKQTSKSSNNKKFAFSDTVNNSLGSTLRTFGDDEEAASEEETGSALAQAAQKATNMFKGHTKANWPTFIELSQRGTPFICVVGNVLAAIRVLNMSKFSDLLSIAGVEGDELSKMKAFVEEFMPGHESRSSLSAGQVFECVLVRATRVGASQRHAELARKLSNILIRAMTDKQCRTMWGLSEAVPFGKMIQDYSRPELRVLDSKQTRYLSSDTELARRHRLRAVRVLFNNLHSELAAQKLGLDETSAGVFPFGVMTTAPSKYRNEKYNFFLDVRLSTDKDFIKGLKQRNAPVSEILKGVFTAMKAFKKDHVWANLTDQVLLDDIPRTTLALFSDYISCLQEEENEE